MADSIPGGFRGGGLGFRPVFLGMRVIYHDAKIYLVYLNHQMGSSLSLMAIALRLGKHIEGEMKGYIEFLPPRRRSASSCLDMPRVFGCAYG